MSKTFYITTPLYYVNASPHIGHSYTNIATDTLARYHRSGGQAVFFLTGTDEHGQKVKDSAGSAGRAVAEFVDEIVPHFLGLWQRLNISYDDFIRTTEERHVKTVQRALEILKEKGDIYEADYEGWYCTPCETFWPALQLKEQVCPDCKRPLEHIKEKNFFFRLSKYQGWLIQYIQDHPRFIRPEIRRNEVLGFLQNPLQDLCISRPVARLSWGIPIPFAPDHVTYVWFDALVNYITAPGFVTDPKRFRELWPADYHIIGKDILRMHAVNWPIMLHALGLEPPQTVFAHGWWLIGWDKMSKSKGNVIDPLAVIEKYGVDPYRYFLLREVTFGLDGVFSEEALIARYNADLANDLGNLLNRTLTMVEKYFGGRIPAAAPDPNIAGRITALPEDIDSAMKELNFAQALSKIWELINAANKFIEESAPWKASKAGDEARLKVIIGTLCRVLQVVSEAIAPFMPQTAEEMRKQLNIGGPTVKKGAPLFPRIEK